MIKGTKCDDADLWNEIVYDLGGHPLQLWGWGELKSAHNWTAHRVIFVDGDTVEAAAQLLVRELPAPFRRLVYVPRGPVWRHSNREEVLTALESYVKQNLPGTVLTIEPDDTDMPTHKGWRRSRNTILIADTLVLDLGRNEDDLLQAMTKKTRQYIRKSNREDLVFRKVKNKREFEACLDIYHQTAGRAGFDIHNNKYYQDVDKYLGDSSVILAAFKGTEPVAFLWLAVSSHTAFELYGGMNDAGQTLRANYALKWHAITTCKEWGIDRYDMNGLLNDGVSTFKEGFANHKTTLAGTYDYPLSPLYSVWSKGLPKAKKFVRKIKSLRK